MTTDRTATPPVRQRDPLALRMLIDVLALERRPWPETRPAYAAALLALGTRLDRVEARAEWYRWAVVEFGGLLMHRRALVRECRADALADITAEIAGTVLRFRSGLDDARRPNLRSMIRASIIWRAGDTIESHHERHARRAVPELRDDDRRAVGDPETAALAREAIDGLDRDNPAHRALMMVGIGFSVAEAARATGASRQQIYRAREGLTRQRPE